jgi:hypothetical protein
MKDYNPNPTWVVAFSGDEQQTADSSDE